MLLFPVLILSLVISQIVLSYCTNQLIEQNTGALEQLGVAIDIQTDQLDAYAVQTTWQSDFFKRNQKNTGDMYAIRKILSSWSMESSFADRIAFYNNQIGKIYTIDAVYEPENFYRWCISSYGVEHSAYEGFFSQEANQHWVSSFPTQGNGGKLWYITSARLSQSNRNWLVCDVDLNTLSRMIENTRLYDESVTYIGLNDGTLLYASGAEDKQQTRIPDVYLNAEKSNGVVKHDGVSLMYVKFYVNDLVILATTPTAIANAPINALWQKYMLALFLITVIGFTALYVVMRVNYRPIRQLESEVLSAQPLSEMSDDALANVRKALMTMQQQSNVFALRTTALDKERLILRLLIGQCKDVEEFNRQGKAAGLRLSGDRWFLADICFASSQAAGEDTLPRIAQMVKQVWGNRQGLMYLEIPETHRVIFVASGDPSPEDNRKLEEALLAETIGVRLTVGEVCRDAQEIALAWQKMSGSAADAEKKETFDPTDQYKALENALEFAEAERIEFTMKGLMTCYREHEQQIDSCRFCYEVLRTANSYLERIEHKEGKAAISSLLTDVFARKQMDETAVCFTLEEATKILCACVSEETEKKDLLINRILAYIEKNYSDQAFSVQQVADTFDLSISNLGHYFKNHVGISVSEYTESLRICHAQDMLKNTTQSVAAIAEAVGYLRPESFMRAFKKVCGVSPTNYRSSFAGGEGA